MAEPHASPRPDPGTARIRSEFDTKAPTYESDRLAPWYQAQADLVLEHIGPVAGPVVDVGCGSGWLLRCLARSTPGASLLGLDLSAGMIDVARETARSEGLPSVRFLQADWEGPQAADRVRELVGTGADVVTCVSAFHYFRDPRTALERMRSVLRPGGRLLLLERARDGAPMTALWDFLHRRFIRDQVRFYREPELAQLMTDAGFEAVESAARVQRWFWKGKVSTSLVLLRGLVEMQTQQGASPPSRPADTAFRQEPMG